MSNISKIAAALRIEKTLPPNGEPDIAVLSRAIVDRTGNIVLKGDDITALGMDLLTIETPDQLTTILGNAGSFVITGTIQTVGVTLIATIDVPADKFIQITNFALKVNGGTAWDDADTIAFVDGSGNVYATIAKAALTANAFVLPSSAGVTLGPKWMTGGVVDSGLFLNPSIEEETGSPVLIKVCGQFIDAPGD